MIEIDNSYAETMVRVSQTRKSKAQATISAGGKIEDAAIAVFGRADGITIAAVRDLLREEGR